MRLSFTILVILLFFIFSACKKNDKEEKPAVEIFPLKTGNQWVFRTTGADSVISTHINEVLKDTALFGGEQWYVLTYDTNIRTVCRNKSDGWWFIYSDSQNPSGIAVIYYKYPAAAMAEYMTFDSTLIKITSVNETITVPAGTFICYHYKMVHYLDGYDCDEYFAPGIGFIRHEIYFKKSGKRELQETTELMSYHLH